MTKTLPCVVCYDGVPVGTVELELRREGEFGDGHIVTSSPRHPAVSRVRALWMTLVETELPRYQAGLPRTESGVALFDELSEICRHFSLEDQLRNLLPADVVSMIAIPLAAGVKLTARFSTSRALGSANAVVPPRAESGHSAPA